MARSRASSSVTARRPRPLSRTSGSTKAPATGAVTAIPSAIVPRGCRLWLPTAVPGRHQTRAASGLNTDEPGNPVAGATGPQLAETLGQRGQRGPATDRCHHRLRDPSPQLLPSPAPPSSWPRWSPG
jgi:hypothetical protein